MRIAAGSFQTARNGAYLHRLIETSSTTRAHAPVKPPSHPAPIIEASPRADAEHVHKIYSILLRAYLVLSEPHKADLMLRGLDAATIDRNGYRSTPRALYAAKTIARELAQHHDLRGVPGFYKEAGEWRMVWMDEGIIIPVRDQNNGIVALVYRRRHARRDEDFGKYIWISSAEDKDGKPREAGASSGAPCHYANSHMMKNAEAVTLTEGALKATIAAHLLNAPVIGNAPSCFSERFAAKLKRDFPQLRTVFVAFDMDFKRNEHVKAALFRLVEQLEKARFDVRVRMWPDKWKGIDDYLLAVASQKEVAA